MSQEALAVSARPSEFYRERTNYPLAVAEGVAVPKEFTHIKVSDLPAYIQEGSFIDPDYGTPIRFRYMVPPVIRGTVLTSITGLKENITLSNERIQSLYEQGVPYICLELPNAGKYTNIMPLYEKYVKFFLLHQDSPVHQLFPNIDKEIQAHSTGGLLALKIALKDEPAEIQKHYKALYCDAPFTDNPNSSEQDHWIPREIFTAYANFHKDRLVEDTFFGNFYMIDGDVESGKIIIPEHAVSELTFKVGLTAQKMMKVFMGQQPWEQDAGGLEGRYRLPSYGQILEIREVGRALKQYLRDNPEAAQNHLPIIIYSHDRDRFSSHKSTSYIADLIGAKLIASKGYHNNINNDDSSFGHMQDNIELGLHEWPVPELVVENRPPAWPLPKVFADSVIFQGEYLVPEKIEQTPAHNKRWTDRFPLPRVFRFPVETPVRLFNTAANFLQQTFSHSAEKNYSTQNAKTFATMRQHDEIYVTVANVRTERDFIGSSSHFSASAEFNGYTDVPMQFKKGRPASVTGNGSKPEQTLKLAA